MSAFDNVFDTSIVDYSEDFHKKDLELVKEKIRAWVDEHCSFAAEPNSGSSSDNKDMYEVDDDLVIQVKGNVNVRSDEDFPDIIKFGKIDGSFFMMGQKLTSTKGFPTEIGDSLWIYDTAIETIVDFPSHIKNNCCLRHNKIKNLNGISLQVDGNLDVCDNAEDFDYSPREDGQTINVGVSFYGSLDDKILTENINKDSKYMNLGGDKEEKSVAFAKYLDTVHCPIKVGCVARKGFIWHSKGEI